MSSQLISIDEAKRDKLFYVVANVVIVNPTNKTCLLLKRSDNEKVLNGKWAFPGGKLEHDEVEAMLSKTGQSQIDGINDILGVLAAREAKDECGLVVVCDNAPIIKNKVFIRPDRIPVFMATLVAEYAGGNIVLEPEAFTEYAWVNKDQLDHYDTVDSVRQEARQALDLY